MRRRSGARTALPRVCALTLVLATSGCRQTDPELRAEAARLSRAVDVLRQADNAEKAGPLEALERLECTADDLCALKERCASAYRLHVDALAAVAKVRRATRGNAEPLSVGAVQMLQEATQQLETAKKQAKECADREGEIARKYRL